MLSPRFVVSAVSFNIFDEMPTSYLVTGCNRGLGFELVKQLSERRDVIIFASVRNPGNVPELEAIAKKTGNIRIVKINSESVEDAEQVQSMIAKEVGKLDVLVANAGIAKYNGLGKDTPLQEFKDHWNVNVLTVVILFQAMWPLLQKSSKPKFIPISSGAGSIGSIKPGVGGRNCAYGASKAALNFICVKIQAEHAKDNLIAFPMNPGWARTEMGNFGARDAGMKEAPVDPVDSVTGMLKIMDNCDMGNCGKMWSFEGNTIPF